MSTFGWGSGSSMSASPPPTETFNTLCHPLIHGLWFESHGGPNNCWSEPWPESGAGLRRYREDRPGTAGQPGGRSRRFPAAGPAVRRHRDRAHPYPAHHARSGGQRAGIRRCAGAAARRDRLNSRSRSRRRPLTHLNLPRQVRWPVSPGFRPPTPQQVRHRRPTPRTP